MKTILKYIFIFSLFINSVYSEINMPNPLLEIKKLINENRIDEAIQVCNKFIETSTNRDLKYSIRYEKALIYLKYKNSYDQSIAQLIELEKDLIKNRTTYEDKDKYFFSYIYWQIANIYQWKNKEYSKAIDYYNKVITICTNSPKMIESLYERSWCFLSMKEYKKSADSFKVLYSKYPNSVYEPRSLYEAGVCYQKAEDFKNAKRSFKKLISKFPNNEWAEAAKYHLKWLEINYLEEHE